MKHILVIFCALGFLTTYSQNPLSSAPPVAPAQNRLLPTLGDDGKWAKFTVGHLADTVMTRAIKNDLLLVVGTLPSSGNPSIYRNRLFCENNQSAFANGLVTSTGTVVRFAQPVDLSNYASKSELLQGINLAVGNANDYTDSKIAKAVTAGANVTVDSSTGKYVVSATATPVTLTGGSQSIDINGQSVDINEIRIQDSIGVPTHNADTDGGARFVFGKGKGYLYVWSSDAQAWATMRDNAYIMTALSGVSNSVTANRTIADTRSDSLKAAINAKTLSISGGNITLSGSNTVALPTPTYGDTLLVRYKNDTKIGLKIWSSGNGSQSGIDNPDLNYINFINEASSASNYVMYTGQTANPSRITTAGSLRSIIGGYDNEIAGSLANHIFGGHHNMIYAPVTHATSVGGSTNRNYSGNYNFTISGALNGVSGSYSGVIGGTSNRIRGDYSVAISGYNSQQDTLTNYVLFGATNNASIGSSYSAILAGDSNRILASSPYSFIPFGIKNEISSGALMSSAMGFAARTTNVGQVAFANGYFANKGDCQVSTYVVKQEILANTPAELRLSNTGNGRFNRVALPEGSRCAFSAIIIATNVTNNEEAMYRVEGVAVTKNNVTTVKNITKTVIYEDDAAWDINVTNTANSLNIVGIGDSANTTRWAAELKTVIITF